MPRPKKYQSKAVTTTIKVSSRASTKVKDNYYTIEYTEERTVPPDADLQKERDLLWDEVNEQVDNRTLEIVKTFSP